MMKYLCKEMARVLTRAISCVDPSLDHGCKRTLIHSPFDKRS